jgi:hypothetical protein
VKVKIPDRERGGQRTEVVRVVDCEILLPDAEGLPGSRRNRAKTGRSVGIGFHRAVKSPIRVKSNRMFT